MYRNDVCTNTVGNGGGRSIRGRRPGSVRIVNCQGRTENRYFQTGFWAGSDLGRFAHLSDHIGTRCKSVCRDTTKKTLEKRLSFTRLYVRCESHTSLTGPSGRTLSDQHDISSFRHVPSLWRKRCAERVLWAPCAMRADTRARKTRAKRKKNRKITTRNSSLALCTPVYVVNETNDVSDAREPDKCAATVQYV